MAVLLTKPLNLRLNIQRRGKSRYEISIDHYRNVCKSATFPNQFKIYEEMVMKME